MCRRFRWRAAGSVRCAKARKQPGRGTAAIWGSDRPGASTRLGCEPEAPQARQLDRRPPEIDPQAGPPEADRQAFSPTQCHAPMAGEAQPEPGAIRGRAEPFAVIGIILADRE